MNPGSLDQPPPLVLSSGNVAENWKKFYQRYIIYIAAIGGRREKDEDKKIGTFLHVAGEEAIDFYNTIEEDHQKSLDLVVNEFNKYCIPKQNVTLNRYRFNTHCQEEGQSIQIFVKDLKLKAADCEFGELKDSLIKDRLICGIRDKEAREMLLSKPELTLDKAVELLINRKVARDGSAVVEQGASVKTEPNIDVVKRASQISRTSGNRTFQGANNYGNRNRNHNRVSCSQCGLHHHGRVCPASGQKCHKCGRLNHFAAKCFTRNIHAMNIQSESDQIQYDLNVLDDIHLDTVNISIDAVGGDNTKDWKQNISINGADIVVKLDSGAQVNVLKESNYNQINKKPPLSDTNRRLIGYGGAVIPVLGKSTFLIKCKGIEYTAVFYVVPDGGGGSMSLLGRDDCERFGLISRVGEVFHLSYSLDDPMYQDLFKGLGCLPGNYKIKLKPDVTPVVHPARKIPFPMHDKVRAELKRMEDLGVIEAVNEPTEWVSSMVMVPKKNGDVRVCLDPRNLNRAIRRQHFKLPTREEIMAKFSGATIFSKLDAASGFWQLVLDDESSYLCTFNTPFGRFRYKRLPFGISSAPEVYHQTINQLFADINKVDTSMDDIILWGRTKQEHDEVLAQTLTICRQNNLKLNKAKCLLGVKELVFLGDLLTSEGVKPDPGKVSAIKNMDRPTCKQELQRFLGMITYLAKWIPGFSEKTSPLRQLLKENTSWEWSEHQESSWELLKKIVCSQPVLEFYDPNKPMKLSTDASQDGLGGVLLQLHGDLWKPVSYASRPLLDSEKRYAQIEKELLAINYGCQRFHQFIHGSTVEAETDHKPLVSLFQKPLIDCPLRIQKMLLKLQKYDLIVNYVPGKQLVVADTLSRSTDPSYKASRDETKAVEEMDYHISEVMRVLPISQNLRTKILEEISKDDTIKQLHDTIIQGWPTRKDQCTGQIRFYWSMQEELTVMDGLIFKGNRLLIPNSMQKEMLNEIHQGHMGIDKCQRRARESVYWPGISNDVKEMVKACRTCIEFSKAQQQEPLMPHPTPQYPFQKVGADLFELKNKNYLVVADYFSLFPEIVPLSSLTSLAIQNALKPIFSRYGCPEVLFTDNGSQFSSKEFAEFVREWNVEHHTSSPRFPQSNGLAESAVKNAKSLITKSVHSNGEVNKALQAYRATPVIDGLSPAELLMGRKIRTPMPFHPSRMIKPWMKTVVQKRQEIQHRQKNYYDRAARTLRPLTVGERVRIRDNSKERWVVEGTVDGTDGPRSYIIVGADGVKYRRNRRHLKPIPILKPNPNTEPMTSGLNSHSSKTRSKLGTPLTSHSPVMLRRSARVRARSDR